MKQSLWLGFMALAVGFALGITYAWVLDPSEPAPSSPALLRADFRDTFRFAIASAYAATGDLERARARLQLLDDTDSIQALTAQAQRMLASGQPFDHAQQLALLASDLQLGEASFAGPVPLSASTAEAPPLPAPADAPQLGAGITAQPAGSAVALVTPFASLAAPPIGTRTPLPSPRAPFVLVQKQEVCGPSAIPGLLQVTVLDRDAQPLPGVEIAVTWSSGEERFYTGLQPEAGNGYADYLMQLGTAYSVKVARVGAPVSGLAAPSCAAGEAGGTSSVGGLKLIFQEP